MFRLAAAALTSLVAVVALGVAEASRPLDPGPGTRLGTGDSPALRPDGHRSAAPAFSRHPDLRAGPYVFPVYGPVSVRRTESAPAAAGVDLFGELGQPLVACADGTLFGVGWSRGAGNRLWLRDRSGNTFAYSHLSAFSTGAFEGAHVRAGQVIGFVGRTGRVSSSRSLVHFEVHPVSLLYLGPAGSVDPLAYLRSWPRASSLPLTDAAGWAPAVRGIASAPEPGAMLVGARDISSGDGLDPATLRRILR